MAEPSNRRQFLIFGWTASMAALFFQAVGALFKFLQPQRQTEGFGGFVKAGQLEEFPPGSISHVQAGQLYISHLEDIGLIAMWHRCTHLGCTVPWLEEQGQFNCPCHSSIFNRAGEVIDGPAPRPLDLFPIEIEDGEVFVNTGQVVERRSFEPEQATKV